MILVHKTTSVHCVIIVKVTPFAAEWEPDVPVGNGSRVGRMEQYVAITFTNTESSCFCAKLRHSRSGGTALGKP